MKDWREDPSNLRNHLVNKKGYTVQDLASLQSEKVVDQLQNEFNSYSKQQQQQAQRQQAKEAEQRHAERVQAIVNDKKRSPQARIEDLLTMGDDS